MNRRIFSFIVSLFICFVFTGNIAGQEIITLGIMAPEGSDWGRVLSEMNRELMERSENQLRFQIYWNQSEKNFKNFDAASLTGCALGRDLISEIFVLQLPMLFSNYAELDCVRSKLTPRFEQGLAEEGYVLLGWAEFGFIHLFSKEPIKTHTDLHGKQVWAWTIDPIGKEFICQSGQEPVVLSIETALDSLRESIIDTVYISPLACIQLGWHTEVRYMADFRLSAGIGATIISQRRYDELSPEHKNILKEVTQEYHRQLIETIREENKKAIDTLEQYGIEVIQVPTVEKKQWDKAATNVQSHFVGDLYEKDLLDEVRKLLIECNAKSAVP